MKRLILIHWNREEGKERAEHLRGAGYTVRCYTTPDSAAFRSVVDDPPDALVIDLGRLPAQGRDVAVWFRGRKATRNTPIVFIEGDPERTEQVRKLLPDATYTQWTRIRSALRQAMRRPLRDPVAPGAMAGYAGTPLPRKLGIRAGSVLALLGAPADFERVLGKLPEEVRVRKDARGRADVIILFAKSQADLDRRFLTAARALAEGGKLWIAWRKKSSGVVTDLTQKEVRAFGLDAGFVDYKISAIDQIWSGLCFARRG